MRRQQFRLPIVVAALVLAHAGSAAALDFTITRPSHRATIDLEAADALGMDPGATLYGTIAAREAADLCAFLYGGGTATDAYVDYGIRTKPYHMKLIRTLGCDSDASPAGSKSLFSLGSAGQQVAVVCGPQAGTEVDACDAFVASAKSASRPTEEL